jgi:hypothetical protein
MSDAGWTLVAMEGRPLGFAATKELGADTIRVFFAKECFLKGDFCANVSYRTQLRGMRDRARDPAGGVKRNRFARVEFIHL